MSDPDPDPVYTFNLICEAIIAFIGLIFNGYILFVLLCSKVTVNNILLLFMALANTAICLLILFANTPITLLQDNHAVSNLDSNSSQLIAKHSLDQWVCNAQGALWTVLPLCIVWTICGLVLDRYIAIVEPLSYMRIIKVRKTAIMLVSVWICLTCFAFPPLIGCCEYRFFWSHSGCIVMCPGIGDNAIQLYYMVSYFGAFVVPIVVIIICNAHILVIARNHRHRIVSALYEITIRAQATITHQPNERHPTPNNYLLKYRGRDAFFTIFQLVGSLVFLTVPYYLIYAIKTFSNKPYDDYWTSVATLVLSITPIVNGYVYGVKSKALKKTFKRLLQRYLYEQQASIEIDRRLSLRSQSSLREGWNSLLTTSSLSSSVLYGSGYGRDGRERRNSAPLTFSSVTIVKDDENRFSIRRQSLENFSETQLNSTVPLTKRPSFLAETKLNNKTPLSPIQEISNGFSENSSFVVNSE